MQLDIQEIVYEYLTKNCSSLFNTNKRLQLAEDISQFVEDAIEKYIEGQMEHGGDIMDKDLDNEIYKENIDLFWYNAANKRKREKTTTK